MLIVPHTVRVSKPSRFPLCLCLYLSFTPTSPFFPSIFPFPYFSSQYEICAVLRQLLWTSVVPISYWILPREPLLFTIANGSIHASENNNSSWRNFSLYNPNTVCNKWKLLRLLKRIFCTSLQKENIDLGEKNTVIMISGPLLSVWFHMFK